MEEAKGFLLFLLILITKSTQTQFILYFF